MRLSSRRGLRASQMYGRVTLVDGWALMYKECLFQHGPCG